MGAKLLWDSPTCDSSLKTRSGNSVPQRSNSNTSFSGSSCSESRSSSQILQQQKEKGDHIKCLVHGIVFFDMFHHIWPILCGRLSLIGFTSISFVWPLCSLCGCRMSVSFDLFVCYLDYPSAPKHYSTETFFEIS